MYAEFDVCEAAEYDEASKAYLRNAKLSRRMIRELLYYACRMGFTNAAEILLQRDKRRGKRCMYMSCKYGQLTVTAMLLKYRVYGKRSLAIAQRNGHTNIVKLFSDLDFKK